MQQRESRHDSGSPLDILLARTDDAALDYVTDELMRGGDVSTPPAAQAGACHEIEVGVEAG